MRTILFVVFAVLFTDNTRAQKTSRFTSWAGELNFSSAVIESSGGLEEGSLVRFAPWFNLQVLRNWDRKHFGLFAGLTVHNVGFIYENGIEKWKARTYNAGVPVGIKIGNMDGFFFYGGYEFEMPFHYKEKYFNDDAKERTIQAWASSRVNPYMHAVMAGLNLPKGFNVKFKYYLTEFFNPSFKSAAVNDRRDLRYPGNGLDPSDPGYIAPRDYLTVNIFYVALTWSMFTKPVSMRAAEKKEETESVY